MALAAKQPAWRTGWAGGSTTPSGEALTDPAAASIWELRCCVLFLSVMGETYAAWLELESLVQLSVDSFNIGTAVPKCSILPAHKI